MHSIHELDKVQQLENILIKEKQKYNFSFAACKDGAHL